jgi:hypothetical protein
MGSISNCPVCGNRVSIPEGIERQALVRCPLCDAEFPLERALAGALDPPPELVPVAQLSAGDAEGRSVAQDRSAGPAPAAKAPADLSPADETSDGLSLAEEYEIALKEEGPTAGPQAAKEEGAPPDDGGTADREPADSEEVYAVAGEAGEAGEPEGEKYDFGGQAPGGPGGFGLGGAASVWRSQQAGPSVLGQIGKFLGIVLGGLFGIAFAYLVLSIVSPAHFDYLHVWGRRKPAATDGKTPGTSPAAPRAPGEKDGWPGLE